MPFPRRTSVQAQEVIRRAYQELESAVSVPDATRFKDTTIQDVQKACRILENELGARGLLRNMGRLEPLLKGLECYGKVVDTLCQGTPFLPWIWAPIVTILKVSTRAHPTLCLCRQVRNGVVFAQLCFFFGSFLSLTRRSSSASAVSLTNRARLGWSRLHPRL